MWVDPTVRRSGVGRALLRAVVSWARSARARRLMVELTQGNAAAVRLYQQAGFTLTNDLTPLCPGSVLLVQGMRLDL